MNEAQLVVLALLLSSIGYGTWKLSKMIRTSYDLLVLFSSFQVSTLPPIQQMLYQHTLLCYGRTRDLKRAIEETKKAAPLIQEAYNQAVREQHSHPSEAVNAALDDILTKARDDGSKPN